MTQSKTVLVRREGHAAVLVLNRPERRNALSFEMLEALRLELSALRNDPEVRVVVLTGAGDSAFCAGGDLGGITGEEIGPVPAHEARGQLIEIFREMWQLGKPTIARVHGFALAGGFGLAMACDYVIASSNSSFGTPEAKVGLWPYMITVPMLRSMQPKVALDLMMTGRRVDAAEGQRLGFVSRVVPADALDDAVNEQVEALTAVSPTALRLGRTSFYSVLDATAEHALSQLQASLSLNTTTGDAAEGLAAFAEKRAPVWPGN